MKGNQFQRYYEKRVARVTETLKQMSSVVTDDTKTYCDAAIEKAKEALTKMDALKEIGYPLEQDAVFEERLTDVEDKKSALENLFYHTSLDVEAKTKTKAAAQSLYDAIVLLCDTSAYRGAASAGGEESKQSEAEPKQTNASEKAATDAVRGDRAAEEGVVQGIGNKVVKGKEVHVNEKKVFNINADEVKDSFNTDVEEGGELEYSGGTVEINIDVRKESPDPEASAEEALKSKLIDGETITKWTNFLAPLFSIVMIFLFGFKVIPNFFPDGNNDALFGLVGSAVSMLVSAAAMLIAHVVNKRRKGYYSAMRKKYGEKGVRSFFLRNFPFGKGK